uniref:Uncharacterized protein n=1 Tax=Noctiluca scintillans TaxID=2966 RepID=A0A7S1FCU0_NOCSC|mmetsp:Transcript_50751/g.135342  ORF Transcript_50751/g.135342 Transcript_50751/m.135342 type:complete len:118 (+) Transcript_50751:63-416(+)
MFLRAVTRCNSHSLPIYGDALLLWHLVPRHAYAVGSLVGERGSHTMRRPSSWEVTFQPHEKLARCLSSARSFNASVNVESTTLCAPVVESTCSEKSITHQDENAWVRVETGVALHTT